MIVTRILSDKATNSLGQFEVDYIVDPAAVTILQEYVYTTNYLNMCFHFHFKMNHVVNVERKALIKK